MSKRLRHVLTVALVAVAALALGASAAFAGPKEIAYVCHGEDICLLDPDNPSTVTNLTDDGTTSYEEDPVWSPDGKKVAFVAKFISKFPQEENIYTMEPEAPEQGFNIATQITHFTNGLVATNELAWSPDGSKIAFVRGGAPFGSNPLYVVNANGSSANATEILTAGGGATPTWSPDSGKIAFWHGNQIYTAPGDASSAATPLPGATCTEPAWSPDGSKIACGREFKEVQIFGIGGGTPLTTITNNSQFGFLSWSPSGAQLAYHEQEGENSYFHIVNSDGSGNHPLPIVQNLNANGPAPSWSPDGTRLVFQGFYSFEGEETNKVYIANADGSGSVTPLTPDQTRATSPAWRPNPVAHPGPQVITPSGPGGSSAPLPGPTVKPTLKWFTNRIFVSPGAQYVPMLSVGCGGPVCNAGGTGTTKGSVVAGIRPRPALTATASGNPKAAKKKPKTIVVAKGKVHVPSGQTRILKLKLTKLAIAILKKVGKLKMSVTVTITIAGQPPTKETRPIELFVKTATKTKK